MLAVSSDPLKSIRIGSDGLPRIGAVPLNDITAGQPFDDRNHCVLAHPVTIPLKSKVPSLSLA